MAEQQQYKTVDKYDRIVGALVNLPDVAQVKPTTVEVVTPITGEAQTFIVRTFRQKERGDFIGLQYGAAGEYIRIVIPPEVADVIARQRDALTTKNRKRAAKAEAQRRKAAGIEPGFLKFKGKKKA